MPYSKLFRAIRFVAILIFAVAAGFGNASAQQEATKSRVMIVLDASGSMWGQVGGKPKIQIAREVIRDLMSRWDAAMDLGLMAYGHRSKGDCGDIETLIPTGPADPKTIIAAVDALNPKGKTPLTAAVTRAAEALRYTEESATVILVSDGLETCNADPCAAAQALESAGVNFTAHVIGFNLKEEEQKQLRCLADKTGGIFLAANDASTLQSALGKAVETAKAETVKAPPPSPEPAKPEGVRFNLLYAEGGPQVKQGTAWNIYLADRDINGARRKVTYSYDASPLFKLEPGRYVAEATAGDATREVEFEVAAGDAKAIDVVLNAGLAALAAKRSDTSDAISDGLSWDVFLPEMDLEGRRRKISYSYDAKPVFTLPAGRYLVNVVRGAASTNGEIEVKAGARVEQAFILNSGVLAAQAVLAEGGAPISGGLSWDIYLPEKDIQGNRKRVTYSYDSQANWELSAGKYLVYATRGSAAAGQEVSIAANRRTERTIVLNAGLLAAKATGATSGWEVYTAEADINGKRRRVTYSYDRAPNWTLPAGRYLVQATGGDKKVSGEVEIVAGQRAEITLDLQ